MNELDAEMQKFIQALLDEGVNIETMAMSAGHWLRTQRNFTLGGHRPKGLVGIEADPAFREMIEEYVDGLKQPKSRPNPNAGKPTSV